jgi:hypothetical protein
VSSDGEALVSLVGPTVFHEASPPVALFRTALTRAYFSPRSRGVDEIKFRRALDPYHDWLSVAFKTVAS